jgi:N-acetylneuraminic acid mutarotase
MVNINPKLLIAFIFFILFISAFGTVQSPFETGSGSTSSVENQLKGETIEDTPPIVESEADSITHTRNVGNRAGREASQISLEEPIILPEVPANWTQDNWSQGGGQTDWSNSKMYETTTGLDGDFSDGRLEIEKGNIVEAWRFINYAPMRRYEHSAVWDPVKEQLLVYGGIRGWSNIRNTLHGLDPATGVWTQLANRNPPRSGHSAVWNSNNNTMLVFGGMDDNGDYLNELVEYNPLSDTWSKKNSSGPSGRMYCSAVFDPSAGVMIVYGGYNGTWSNLCRDVWIYNATTDKWMQKNDFIKKAHHGAVWHALDKRMYVYGGADKWSSGSGYVYSRTVSAYDHQTDVWENKTFIDGRVQPIMTYDPIGDRIISYGGFNESSKNDTRFYYPEIDVWEQTIDGPGPRYYAAGAWDTTNNQFLMYGGREGQNTYYSLFAYSPYTPVYIKSGSLISSTFDSGSQVKFKKISYVTSDISPECGSQPVRIQLAGSQSKPTSWDYIGPDGTGGSYYTNPSGETLLSTLEGSRYLKYYLNFSTEDILFSPQFRSIRIDYFTYKSQETFDSKIYDRSNDIKAVHKVEWNITQPDDTSYSVFIRYGQSPSTILTGAWEEVENSQQAFKSTPANYFQYRVILSSTDPILTPVVERLVFSFNRAPLASNNLSPGNDTFWGTTTPEFSWTFQDPDGLVYDEQESYHLQVSFREGFDYLNYDSGEVDSNVSLCKSDAITPDGQYYWRVRTRDNYGTWGPWSPVYKIYIDTDSPAPPEIKCYTHPSSGTFYSSTTAIFDWDAATDVSGIAGYSYDINRTAATEPAEIIMLSANEFSLKKNENVFQGLVRYANLEDGIWYFHLRAADRLDHWGTTNTYMLKVDSSEPEVIDNSDEDATTGEDLNFRFELDDAYSGLSSAELYWRYSAEAEYQYKEVIMAGDNFVILSYTMKDIDSDYIEYYLLVTDNAEPPNTYRHPGGSSAQIPLMDNDGPGIINSSRNFKQELASDMIIFVSTKDNINVVSAELFIGSETTPRPMLEVSNNNFEYTLDPSKVRDLFQDGTVKELTYYIIAKDKADNTVREPLVGFHTITLTESITDGDPTKTNGEKGSEAEGFIYGIAAAVAAVVILVVLIVFMWLLMRRKEKEFEDERSKMKMAILGSTPPTGLQPAPGMPGMEPTGELAGMAGITQTPSTPQGIPELPDQKPSFSLPPAQQLPEEQLDTDTDQVQTGGYEGEVGTMELPDAARAETEPDLEPGSGIEDLGQQPAVPEEDISFTPPESYTPEPEEPSMVTEPGVVESIKKPVRRPKLKKKKKKVKRKR